MACREAAARLAEGGEPATREAWIPVTERMPESGKPVLACFEGAKTPVRAMWVPAHSISTDDMNYEGDAVYDEAEDRYYWPENWYEWNRFEETHWAVDKPVTHWMPLPELPAEPSTPPAEKQRETR